MKHLTFLACFVFFLMSCGDKAKTAEQQAAKPATNVNLDSTGMADALHSFFKWYGTTGLQLISKNNFVDTKGKHPKLDEAILARYLAEFVKTGTVNAEFVANETNYYRECAKSWKEEASGEVISCMDYDRYYCAQDGDFKEFLTAEISSTITGDDATVQLLLDPKGPNGGSRNFEMKKENGKWLLSKIGCE